MLGALTGGQIQGTPGPLPPLRPFPELTHLGGYDQLCNCIIRPARYGLLLIADSRLMHDRCEYTLKDLGPNRFRASGIEYTRTDFELRNPRGLKLQASH